MTYGVEEMSVLTCFKSDIELGGQLPLEVLVESLLTSSVKDRESFSSPEDMGCTEVFSSCSTQIDDLLYLRRFSQGISRDS